MSGQIVRERLNCEGVDLLDLWSGRSGPGDDMGRG